MVLRQVMYRSRRSEVADPRSLAAILDASRRNNCRDQVTGFLISAGPWFLQILEGPVDQISKTLSRIERDDRHSELVTITSRETRARSFPEWSMGSASRSSDTLAIYTRYGLQADFNPRQALAPVIFALAMDLQDHERQLRGALRLAG